MLSAADFPDIDFATLQRNLRDTLLRQRRASRLAKAIGIPDDLPGGCRDAIDDLDREVDALADAERIVARLVADQARGRPHLRIVS